MLSKNRIKELQSLSQKKFRNISKTFLAEGEKIVLELLDSEFPLIEIICTQEWLFEKGRSISEKKQFSFTIAEKFQLEKISSLSNPPDVIAVCAFPQNSKPLELNKDLILFLDSVRDPGNLGTLLRLADWFGITQVIASEDSVEWTNPKVIQSSMGSFIRIQPSYLNSVSFFSNIYEKTKVYAADLSGENIYTTTLQNIGILIVSSESHGLSNSLEPFVYQKIHIPKFSENIAAAESLNVATATAIILSEFIKSKFK
jgi:TrmH family RNA methyltransferase